ncbi:amino acid adenylation domain-containing protein [Bradyrhizobium sp. 83002]|uniref:non-ribosomal peptide synthetase n=1 Tax=Bradyrhizobium aeschynomenes TaxID=2734909 RepID=UPI001554BC31|nr:non-ribosomal peptide synthetase [Bradyrhizobium aeschynomenes]NPU13575.1 amino acid adenylation domain-containing protein [Bradyrhizobium aeschynomenes]
MTAASLLATLKSRGIALFLDGDQLRFRAAPGALTAELRDAIAADRSGIIAHLRDVSRLSSAEKRLWFANRLAPDEAPYNVSAAYRLSGRLDASALEAAFSDVVAGHDALRTGFREINGEPERFIAAPSPFRITQLDRSQIAPGERDIVARDLASRLSQRPIALDQPPLLSATLVRFADDDHLLIHLIHHIVTDGWSHALFCRDLAAAYRARLAGQPWRSAARKAQSGPSATIALGRRPPALPDTPPAPVPHDAVRPQGRPHDGHTLATRLPAGLHARVRAVARQRRTSIATVLLAVQTLLVARLSASSTSIVAVPAAGRRDPELGEQIGFHVDTLLVTASCGSSMRFTELLSEVHDGLAAALDAAGDESSTDPSHSALLAEPALTSFAYQATPDTPLRLDNVDVRIIGFERGTTRFDLELHVWPLAGHATSALLEPAPDSELALIGADAGEPGGLRLMLTARSDSFTRDGAARWLRRYVHLLDACIAEPDSLVADLPLDSPSDLRTQQHVLERPRAPPGGDTGLAARFETIAAAHGQRIAIESSDGRTLSYAALEAASRALGERLVAAGVQNGDIVGVVAERSVEAVVMLLAVIRAGGAYLPLDPTLPEARLALMLRQAGVRHVVTTSPMCNVLMRIDGALRIVVANEMGEHARAALPAPQLIGADSPAYVNFTSGSTGTPKAILVPQRAVANLVLDTDYAALTADDRIAQAAPLSFDAATFEIWGALLNGSCVVMVDKQTLLDPDALARDLQARAVSVMFLTTALFNQVAQLKPAAFAPLRLVLFGGEAVNADHVRRVLAAGPPARLLHVYGPTETTTFATFHPVGQLTERAATVPIGRPLPGVICRILDTDLKPVPAGMPGELCIGGSGLATGYLGDPAATDARFVTAPDGVRLYRSGDLVRLDPNDTIEFVGRRDNQVKIRGHRIEIEEIELALARHPAVAEAAVIVQGDYEDKSLEAFVTLSDAAHETSAVLRWLRQELPDYMIPARITRIGRMPVSEHGKIDRAALRLMRPAAVPDTHADSADDLESEIIAIWSQLLARPIGRDSDFFENGGHSLLATRVLAQLSQRRGLVAPLRLLFEQPTPRLLAAAIAEGTPAAPDTREVIAGRAGTGAAPLSFAQQRLWFLERLDPGTAGYNVPVAYQLDGPLDVPRLQAALDRIVARHEPLRSRIGESGGQSWQEPLAPMPCPLRTVDLRGRPDALTRARAVVAAAALEPFDLTQPPLLRATLILTAPDRAVLALVMHHIACDGWSLTVLARELSLLMSGATLRPLPLRYADFAAWQRDWFSGTRAREQLETWSARLADLPELRLPLDHRRPARQSYRGDIVPIMIDATTTARLKALSERCNATPFMVLLAVYGAVIGRAAAQDDFAVASPIANRHHHETEELIGFFVNTLALRLDLSDAPSLEALVSRVRSIALEAYQNQDLPFEQLVERLQPDRDPARNPLVQVAFALQNATDDRLVVPDVEAAPFVVDIHTTRFDIETHLFERDGAIAGLLVYASDLFTEATAGRLAAQFVTLLTAALDAPDKPLPSLVVASPSELRTQQHVLERPRALPGGDTGLAARFEAVAAAHGQRIAIESIDGRTLSHAALEAASRALGERLVAAGVQNGDIVGVVAERSVEAVVMLLAVIRAGGAYLPLDPTLPEARLALMLRQAGVRHVVTTSPMCNVLMRIDGALRIVVANEVGEHARAALPAPQLIGADSPAYVNFTSGSTGTPKAILVPQGAVANLVLDTDYAALTANDRIAQAAPLSFDAATFEIWGALLNGGCVVMVDKQTLLDPHALACNLQARAVSVMFLTTALFNQVAQLKPAAFAPLRLVLFGGEAVNADHVRSVLAAGPPARLLHVYGPTETTTFATFHPVGQLTDRAATVPIGRPLPGVICRILDADLKPVPAGMPGELCIGGSGLAKGYLGDTAATDARFVTALDGVRLYRSGDLVRLDPNDTIEFVGRRDNQVKIRGHRIEIEEIELALARHPAVAEAAVVVRTKDEDKFLDAYVTLKPDVATAQHQQHGQAFVSDWRELYEITYGPAADAPDADLAGWHDSYTGRPIAVAEMREWQARTTEALLALGPRRVLEIGCGTGLLLRGLADRVETYRGTDFSPPAVAGTRELARQSGWTHVTIEQREADNFDGVPPRSFDLVILNSIIQYFPGRDYLRRVLDGAFECLAPSGRIYLGDIRSLPLQRLFAVSVEARQHALGGPAILARAANRIRFDKELVLDPAYFTRIAAEHGAAVRLAAKRGMAVNELTKYRYEVVIDTAAPPHPGSAASIAWTALDAADPVAAMIGAARAHPALCITGVPDGRLSEDLRLLAGIDPEVAPPAEAPHPEQLAEAAAAAGFAVDFALSERAGDGVFDLLLYPRGGVRPVSPLEAARTTKPWAELSNDPLQTALGRSIGPELKLHLSRLLPDYMIPGQIAVLERMPLARTGKIDRRALPPIASTPEQSEAAAPAGDAERAVHGMWQELLQRDRIDRATNFFDAGGHSLLLVRLLHRINSHFGRDLALIDLFRATTIADQAKLATHEAAIAADSPEVGDRAERRRHALVDRRRSLR